ncbi:entericidin EcnA/B family protein [Rhodosalinus halophilus]|jgi:predicted small secreted protein|uniref:Entericidin EcnA/B family protein n=1 Tax=Rhodosalinus halophilus TaxID=2259333 RepID=A0A365U882_9RHOB|nr:entericidin EcnA/B family protein [Rhodosalinus halophilus]RBI85026.1 entericidin EcnA/B family protein [Rhodosalinus halophilus]
MIRLIASLALVGTLTGCATIDGVGQDISGVARTVEGWFR